MKTQKLKKIIVTYITLLTLAIMAIILIAVIFIQAETSQQRAKEQAEEIFYQVEQILDQNEADLAEAMDEYSESCLQNAETIAYIIQYHPEVLNSLDELKKIADFVQVDEIHIFDREGKIFFGTHPEYYGYNFDSGEQMNFFKPMLEDHSLRLVQEITPNTAEGKLVQYSALWSENEEFIVQVGMYPVSVMRIMKKNEIPYIFSLLRANAGVNLYAIDQTDGTILGASDNTSVGKNITDIGVSWEIANREKNGVILEVNGRLCYTVFTKIHDNIVGYIVPLSVVYANVPLTIIILFIGLIIIAIILVGSFTRYIDKYVIDQIYEVNEELRNISDGDLETIVNVRNSQEFFELSMHINEMVRSLIATSEKMSYVIGRSKLNIGVYELTDSAHIVRYTDYVGRILGLKPDQNGKLNASRNVFRAAFEKLKQSKLDDEDSAYSVTVENENGSKSEVYVRTEEVRTANGDIFGIFTDITDSILQRRQIERERDIDALTGLYNRRGLDNFLLNYPVTKEDDKYCALIMVDVDNLKIINDKYGHEAGDAYLKSAAYILSGFADGNNFCARQGGDEFVVFLYGYEYDPLCEDIDHLRSMQDGRIADLNNGVKVPLAFSLGYTIRKWDGDYAGMLKESDALMYNNKRMRKQKKGEQ